MPIRYLCPGCKKTLNMKIGFDAVNEIGRKHCHGCGDNQDNLTVVDSIACDEAIRRANKSRKRVRSND